MSARESCPARRWSPGPAARSASRPRICSNVPSPDQRRCRPWTVFVPEPLRQVPPRAARPDPVEDPADDDPVVIPPVPTAGASRRPRWRAGARGRAGQARRISRVAAARARGSYSQPWAVAVRPAQHPAVARVRTGPPARADFPVAKMRLRRRPGRQCRTRCPPDPPCSTIGTPQAGGSCPAQASARQASRPLPWPRPDHRPPGRGAAGPPGLGLLHSLETDCQAILGRRADDGDWPGLGSPACRGQRASPAGLDGRAGDARAQELSGEEIPASEVKPWALLSGWLSANMPWPGMIRPAPKLPPTV